ncbi:hypothetical protein AALB53_15415 [Lachnospiraceae bacterium 47-T17]
MADEKTAEKTNENQSPAAKAGASVKAEPSAVGGGSFLDTLYEKITDVIGGDNPNQYFCMTFPGTLIDAADYQYDISGEKPAHVKANESKLVNKLFDACFIAAADNGRQLQNQYRTALSMLSPKLNRDLFEMKVRLRKAPSSNWWGNASRQIQAQQVRMK